MEDFLDYYKIIQNFMDDIKKDILSKTNNLYNLKHSRDILNSLFNLFDYQITFMNQIVLFSKSTQNYPNYYQYSNYMNKDNISSIKIHVNHLINTNKDIMISMIMKFLSKINLIISRYKNNKSTEKNNNTLINLKNESKPLFNQGKYINSLYSNSNNNSFYFNSSNKLNNNSNNKFSTILYKSPDKIKNHKNKNSSISKSNKITSKVKNSPYFNYENNKNNNSILLKKKISNNNNMNNKSKFIYRGLETDTINGKKIKDKKCLKKSNSTINKDITIDLNDKALKTLFNLPIYYKSYLCTKDSIEE